MTKHQLTRIRKSLGMTMGDFARAIGVDPATITRWESGQVKIPPIAVIAINATAEKLANA